MMWCHNMMMFHLCMQHRLADLVPCTAHNGGFQKETDFVLTVRCACTQNNTTTRRENQRK